MPVSQQAKFDVTCSPNDLGQAPDHVARSLAGALPDGAFIAPGEVDSQTISQFR
jgi:hypothetical protein